MANIPVSATVLSAKGGQSVTGSFAGFIACSTGATAYAHFTGLKDANGVNLVVSGSPAALYFKEGTFYPIFVTSASIDTTSANILFFT